MLSMDTPLTNANWPRSDRWAEGRNWRQGWRVVGHKKGKQLQAKRGSPRKSERAFWGHHYQTERERDRDGDEKKSKIASLIKDFSIKGAILRRALSGPAHLQNPLQGVQCIRVFFLPDWPKTVQQSWAQVSPVCGGGPSPVDAWWFSQVWACTFQFGGK